MIERSDSGAVTTDGLGERTVSPTLGLAGGSSRPIETLIVVSSLLNNVALRKDQVLGLSMQAIAELIQAEAGALFVLDEARGEQEVQGSCGAYAMLKGRRFAAAVGIPGWVAARGKSVLLEDAKSDERFDYTLDLDAGFRTGSLLAVPLQAKGRTIGTVLFARVLGSGSFTSEDRTFVRAASHQIAIALENARLTGALEAAQAKARGVDEAKAHFMSLVSHEFLTPLTLLGAQVEMLEGELGASPSHGVQEATAGLRSALQRLKFVTDEILNMVLLDKGEMPVRPQAVDVGALLAEVRETMAGLARRRSIELVRDEQGLPLTAVFCRCGIQQVLGHLVLNAIRFTPDKGQIVLGAARTADGLRLRVSDNGIGIPGGERERIFERMFELGSIQHHHSGFEDFLGGGIGLGLAIARSLVQAQGGQLRVESVEGKGSDFFVDLPGPVM